MQFDFKGQAALVTGGSRGIGRGIALELARNGADIVINYLRNRRAAEQTADEIRELGVRCWTVKCNVADPDKLDEMFSFIREEIGYLDIVISNAASGVLKPPLELDKHHWQWTLEINAWALLGVAQRAVPLMEGRKGKIIAISSIGSVRALPYYTLVGASKAALEATVRSLAVELAPRGINVNTISAGVVDTDALKHFPNREEMLYNYGKQSPMGREVTPEDVGKAVVLLCSPLAEMIQGHTLMVDGGYSILG